MAIAYNNSNENWWMGNWHNTKEELLEAIERTKQFRHFIGPQFTHILVCHHALKPLGMEAFEVEEFKQLVLGETDLDFLNDFTRWFAIRLARRNLAESYKGLNASTFSFTDPNFNQIYYPT